MPRKPKKPQTQAETPKTFDEFTDDAEAGEDEVVGVDETPAAVHEKSRDWRDVEKYKEERALRRLVDDDLDLAEL
ncbi:hypothetical protein AAG565_00395 [Fontimonas sp. SYSU GA230001]|uniref:hypothetical protein n=1 Tax=Fontimonas sp. SYSU GA230001 TaxID=3142450 RepID=UPI0032B5B14B